jgi:ABC-2 type transport system ATP-binding protein
LLRAAPLQTFTQRTGVLAVEVEDGSERLAETLRTRGVRVLIDGRVALVPLDDGAAYDLVRDAVVELGLSLVRLEPRRHSLEDLFRDQAAAA